MKRKIRYCDFIGKNCKKSQQNTFYNLFLTINRNLRHIDIGLMCKLHNNAKLVTSHFIMSYEKYDRVWCSQIFSNFPLSCARSGLFGHFWMVNSTGKIGSNNGGRRFSEVKTQLLFVSVIYFIKLLLHFRRGFTAFSAVLKENTNGM